MAKTKQIGDKGEDLVTELLLGSGYKILERNYHSRFGEVDIIVRKEDVIAFVEVKTRKPNSLISPVWDITKAKQQRIIKTAIQYIQKYELDLQPRFDVCIVVNCENPQFDYFENAFEYNEY